MSDVVERLRDLDPVPRDPSTGWSESPEGWGSAPGSRHQAPVRRATW